MILSVVEDAPKAILVSLAGTMLVILFTFRKRGLVLAAIGSLALGLVGMIAVMALYKARVDLPGGRGCTSRG